MLNYLKLGPFMPDSALPVRPTVFTVDLDAIAHNLRTLKLRAKDVPILAVVKADAYGCGALPVAQRALDSGADWLGVALVAEGLQLRRAGIEAPILLLGPAAVEETGILIDAGLTPAVYSTRFLGALEKSASERGIRVDAHLKVDSGMGRLGIRPEEMDSLLEEWGRCPHVIMDGLFSNLACADEPGARQNDWQLERFLGLLERVREAGHGTGRIHLANSAALLTRPDCHLTLARPGLSLYGMRPSNSIPDPGFRAALSLSTRVVQIKNLPPDTPVGYGGTYVTKEDSRVGVLPAGYGDGLPRCISGKGYVLVHGRRCAILGRISMDLTTVDLDGVPEAAEGDVCTLWGRDGEETLGPWDWAQWSGTIPYEVTCGISARVARRYISEGRNTMNWPLNSPPLE